MNILLQPNPLEAIVKLNENDRARLRYELIIENLKEKIGNANAYLEENHAGFSIEKAKRTLASIDDDGEKEKKWVDDQLQYMEESLLGYHCGDCTSVACSCTKCYAENLLGITTTTFTKYTGNYLQAAFSSPNTTIEEALATLETPITPTQKNAQYVEVWNKHRVMAIKVLEVHALLYAQQKRKFAETTFTTTPNLKEHTML